MCMVLFDRVKNHTADTARVTTTQSWKETNTQQNIFRGHWKWILEFVSTIFKCNHYQPRYKRSSAMFSSKLTLSKIFLLLELVSYLVNQVVKKLVPVLDPQIHAHGSPALCVSVRKVVFSQFEPKQHSTQELKDRMRKVLRS